MYGSRTFASLIENTSLNFFTSGSIIAAWKLLRQHIVVGKSVLIEKKALGMLGGFGYFKNYLAEDFLLGGGTCGDDDELENAISRGRAEGMTLFGRDPRDSR